MHWSPQPPPPGTLLTRTQTAINAKGSLEVAKGMIAEYANVSIAQAAALLYAYTDRHHVRLLDTVHALAGRTLHPDDLVRPAPTPAA